MFYVQRRMLNEYIYSNETQVLSNNLPCYENYKKFICEFNFPACRGGATVSVCKSVCTSFFENCLSITDACEIIYSSKDPGLDTTC